MMATRLLILTMLSSLAAGQTRQQVLRQAHVLRDSIDGILLPPSERTIGDVLSSQNILSGHFVSCVISRGRAPTRNVPCDSKAGRVNDVIVALEPFGYQCQYCTGLQTFFVTFFRETFKQPQYQQECKKLERGLGINGLCL